MKKLFILAAVAAIAAFSCAKTANMTEENISEVQVIDDSVQMPIIFGTTSASVKSLTKAAVDAWNNETLYVYGIPRAGKDDATLDLNNILINNVAATAPASASGTIDVLDENNSNSPFYYTDATYYDFFAYYVGSAVAGAPAPNANLELAVTIDGTQDIMTATPDKSVDCGAVDQSYLYSGYAARRGAQPNLQFKHKLARFVFNVKSGSASSEDIVIDSIKINSVVNGTLSILDETLTPAAEAAQMLFLRNAAGEENLAAAMPAYVANSTTFTQVGESVMVYPGVASHDIIVYMHQTGIVTAPAPIERTITIPSGATVEGKKYNVNLTIYGMEAINISVTLNAWEDGEALDDIDTEI